MSDVFVSYKAEDRKRVKPLVDALMAEGFSVWWDEQIGGGATWRSAIEAELNAARCAIVVWSKRSVGPDGTFVQDEATRAQQRHVYVPVLIDKVHLPLGFGETQALPLTGWRGNRSDPRYRAVLAAVAAKAGERGGARAVPASRGGVDRRVMIAGCTAAVAAAAGIGGWSLLRSRTGRGSSSSIAVLPFENLSGDPGQTYFSDGLAEELRSALARIGLEVVGRTSSEAVKNDDARTAAARLGVSNILTGSVRRSPTTIRISAQLIDGSDGLERWSEDYDRSPGDALSIETEIATKVAQALSVALGKAARAALTVGGTTNAAAQDLYLKARAQLRLDDSEDSRRHALELLDSALTLDPAFAAALAEKSMVLSSLTTDFAESAAEFDSGFAKAASIAKHAIALAPTLAAARVALAYAVEWQLDMSATLVEYRRAHSLPDGDVADLLSFAGFLSRIGNTRAALALVKQAQARDPLAARGYAAEARILYEGRRYADSIAATRKAIQMAPALSYTRSYLASALMHLGRYDDASATLARLPADYVYRLVGEAILLALQGKKAASQELTRRLQQRWGDTLSWQYVEIFAQQRDTQRALEALQRAWSVHDPGLTRMKADPWVEPIQHTPLFVAIEAKLNFPAI